MGNNPSKRKETKSTVARNRNNSETINWNNINTDNVSTTINRNHGLSNQARELVLNIADTYSSEQNFDLDKFFHPINKNLNVSNKLKLNKDFSGNYFSETSPFISEDMYKNIFNEQEGGAKKKKSKTKSTKKSTKKTKSKKGGSLSDDSSTTSTSSISSDSSFDSSSSSDSLSSSSMGKNKKENVSKKHDTKKHDTKKHDTKKHDNKKHDNKNKVVKNDAYTSSSAHTGGEFSDTLKSDKTNNSKYLSTSVSVNTSEINMVSEY